MGERQSEDIPMVENWWGHLESSAIKDTFFDGRIEPELGKVVFEPYLEERPEIGTQNAGENR
jgi:hypothetical protein